jgi:hypothetical protein
MATGNWRGQHRVLVTDAHAIGSVGVIRSLGRAGYRVYAASSEPRAIGLRSSFAERSVVYPSFESDRIAFKDWLRATIDNETITAIVPSEGMLLAIRDEYDRFRGLLPLNADPSIVYAGMSKCDLFERFAGTALETRLPPYILLRADDPIPGSESLARLGLPLFVKADSTYANDGAGDSLVRRCVAVEDAQTTLRQLRGSYGRLLIQGYAAGIGVGAFLLRWNGRILGRFMHRRLHEVPHTGGASSYREAWWNDAIFDDARARIEALQWQGVGMFEYRWNPLTDDFRLLEFNGRFWGSIHLALFAGVDFPRLLLDAFFGHEEFCEAFDLKTRSRWTFPRDVEYVWSRLKDDSLSTAARLGSVLEFFKLGLDPRVHSDLSFAKDRMLYLHGILQAFSRWTGH